MHVSAVVRLLPAVPEHWALVGTLTTRIPAFIQRFHLESNPIMVVRHLTSFWAAGAETVAFWAAMDGEVVVGHAIGIIETSWGVPYGMVMQTEVDAPYTLSLEQQHGIVESLSTWARSQGASCLKMLTPRDPDAWTRYSGFEFDKTLLKLSLKESA